MFDIAWSEMLVIGAVALVVIGPKDLPKALRSVGEAVGKIKRMAAEFQGQFNDAMREAELHDLKKQVEDVGGSVQAATKVDFNPIQTIRDELKAAQPAADPSTPVADFKPQPIEPAIPLPEIPPPFDPSELAPPVVEAPVAAPAEPAPQPARKKSAATEGDAA
ncbi:MAG: twin-arginine translocase subunit TatB [Bosea sp.]|jgi:sec-independent protein translocase protein TatB|nr:twin-arginine translocase subunit TatB [Bosea sp. (in: a-proteobacteria)]